MHSEIPRAELKPDEIVAAFYCRVSSDQQAERGTIEAQVDYAKTYAKLHEINTYKIYCDDGVTGMMPLKERPQGAELLRDAAAGKFNTVYVYKIDRLGRSMRETLNATYQLDGMGVTLRSMTEPFDMTTAMGRFMMQLLANMADLDRNNFLERSRLGRDRVVKEGKWVGGVVPYGYVLDDDRFLVPNTAKFPDMDMSECDVIHLIFELVADHKYASTDVASYLNGLGVPTSYWSETGEQGRGKRKRNTLGVWRSNTVLRIIHNTTYKGIHYFGKRSTSGEPPIPRRVTALIDDDTWERANEVISNYRPESKSVRKKRPYILRRLLRYSICGANFSGVTNTRMLRYYRCGTQMRKGSDECASRYVNADHLENIVWAECQKLLTTPRLLIGLVKETVSKIQSETYDLTPEIEQISTAISTRGESKEKLIQLYTKNVITEDELLPKLKQLKTEIAALEKELTKKEKMMSRIKSADNISEEHIEFYVEQIRKSLDECESPQDKQAIIDSLVDHIDIISPADKTKAIQFQINFRMKIPARQAMPRGVAKTRTSKDSWPQSK